MIPQKPLDTLLFEEGYRFNFFQAIRVLDSLYQDKDSIGRTVSPSRETVRFHTFASLSFPPSPIYEVVPGERPEEPINMTVAFMGLVGSQGVLPRHYTELILERIRERDRTLLDFLDLFNHRFVSLFYRAWEKYHVPVTFERAVVKKTGGDPVSRSLLALVGLGTPGLTEKLAFSSSTILGYAGLMRQQPRSSVSLRQILRDYFQLPIGIKQFVGEWLQLSDVDKTRLTSLQGNNRLGVTTIAGTQVWDQQARFEVKVGPLNHEDFTRMLPSGSMYQTFVQLIRFFVGQELNFDIRLELLRAEVPACRLESGPMAQPRLGWTTWLKCQEFTHDVDDVVFSGESEWQMPNIRRVAVA